MNEEFTTKNLSIVIQGPYIDVLTDYAILEVRNLFHDSEIIFSTYKSKNEIKKLSIVDKIILNDDPGDDSSILKKNFNRNTNSARMIVSSMNGILATSKTWVLRLRSDSYIKSDIMSYYRKFSKLNSLNFKAKILVSSIVDERYNSEFYVSDWVQLGLKVDLLNLYSRANSFFIDEKYLTIPEKSYSNNKGIIPEKILWNSIYDDFDFLNNKINHVNFVKKNLILLKNDSYVLQKYPRNFFYNIHPVFKRYYEVNDVNKLHYLVRLVLLEFYRLIYYMKNSFVNKKKNNVKKNN
jgi:hypothetical protein